MSSNTTRVYVGRLPPSARERDLEKFFKGYGRLTDILMKNGYSFVEFDDPRDADDAVYELNGKDILGEKVLIEHARESRSRRDRGSGRRGFGRDRFDRYGGGGGYGRDRGYGGYGGGRRREGGRFGGPPARTDYRLKVENLSSRASWQDLKDHMRVAGEVSFADAHKQRVGEGVVEFTSLSDMKTALKRLDGTEINGKKIRLSEERPRGRERSFSQSRSRSKSPSNSRSSSSGSRSPPPKQRKSKAKKDDDDDDD